jgi:hypothetical protein
MSNKPSQQDHSDKPSVELDAWVIALVSAETEEQVLHLKQEVEASCPDLAKAADIRLQELTTSLLEDSELNELIHLREEHPRVAQELKVATEQIEALKLELGALQNRPVTAERAAYGGKVKLKPGVNQAYFTGCPFVVEEGKVYALVTAHSGQYVPPGFIRIAEPEKPEVWFLASSDLFGFVGE